MEWNADSQYMRPGFLKSWDEIVKVLEKKAPKTDSFRDNIVICGIYVKHYSSEVHEHGLELQAERARPKELPPPAKPLLEDLTHE